MDDYHLIHSSEIHQQLAFIIEHLPTRVHIILLTREDPLLPLARLRVQGQLLEIRQADLRFTLPETAQFFQHTMGMNLTASQLATLEQRTEGWIAGLQLAALSLQGRSDVQEFVQAFAGSNRFILDYLLDEVFAHQTQEIKNFLLKTSILDQLCAPLCDAVMQDSSTNSQEVLRSLEQANLFVVALDQKREWYRYHHLFSELLRYRLRESPGESVAVLHQRASQWFESQQIYPNAIQHALAAEDWARTVRLLALVNERMFKQGEVVSLVNWLVRLPEAVVRSQPRLCLMLAWALLLTNQFERVNSILDWADELVPPDSSDAGEIATARAYLARSLGQMEKAVVLSEKALQLLPATYYLAISNVAMNLGIAYWQMSRLEDAQAVLAQAAEAAEKTANLYALLTSHIFLARTYAVRGELRHAEVALQEVIRPGGQVPILALAYYDLATIYYEWNDLPQAAQTLDKGLALSVDSHNAEFIVAGYLLRVFMKLAQRDFPAALEAADCAYALIKDQPMIVRDRTRACYVKLALAQNDLERAEYWAGQMTTDMDAHPYCRFASLTRARLLLARGDRQAASERLEQVVQHSRQAGLGICLLISRFLQALAAPTTEQAHPLLLEVLQLAQPEGYLRLFVDEGEPARSLLARLQAACQQGRFEMNDQLSRYLGKILAAFPDQPARGNETGLRRQPPALVEPLSERELEVLALLITGLSNRQIAARLVVSLGTAKTHIHNIYGKLGVINRAQAIARARELGLV